MININYLTFRVGNQWYGIEITRIREVLHLLTLTELPIVQPDLLGLITLRDAVFPVLDLRIRFGCKEVTYKLNTPLIAIQTSTALIGLVVDDVDNVEVVSDSQIVNYEAGEFPYVAGVAKLENHRLLLLDIDQLPVQLPELPVLPDPSDR